MLRGKPSMRNFLVSLFCIAARINFTVISTGTILPSLMSAPQQARLENAAVGPVPQSLAAIRQLRQVDGLPSTAVRSLPRHARPSNQKRGNPIASRHDMGSKASISQVLIRSASCEPVALSARSKSPAERWHHPYSCTCACISAVVIGGMAGRGGC